MLILFIFLLLSNQTESSELEFDMNEDEIYPILDEITAEVDELDDVLLDCNQNSAIYTKSTIKNLFKTTNYDKLDEEHKNHVMAWQILNIQKHFSTNLTYLLIKQVTYKDSGIYYCIFKIPYSSVLSSILQGTFVSKLSKLWSSCQSSNQFECLASFKFKLIVRKAKQRSLNSLKLDEEFKERCLIIKNGKQISQDKTLSLIAMFLASLIFILLLFYFIRMYRDNWINGKKLSRKDYKKELKRKRSEQIQENLEIIKDFEHIRHDEQELLRKLRLEQERLSNKRREDEEFFNKMKSQELELIKRKERIVKEEEELLKKKLKFENEKKVIKNSRTDEEVLLKDDQHLQHLGDEYEIYERRTKKIDSKENETKNLDQLIRPISLNIKGEIKLKQTEKDENKQLDDLINLTNLSKRIKKSRKQIFSPKKSPIKLNDEKNHDLTDLNLFDNLNTKFKNRSPKNRPKFNWSKFTEERRSLLKRKLATKLGQNLKGNLKTDLNRLDKLNNLDNRLTDFKKDDNLNKNDSNTLDIESTINISKKNESIFKTLGKFKVNSNQCNNKAIKLIVETPFPLSNKPNTAK